MKIRLILVFVFAFFFLLNQSNASDFFKQQSSGIFSLGTRNTFSMFNDIEDEKPGVGIGGQFRVQVNDRINTEWFADFITSGIGSDLVRNDYHIGWSVMYYPGKNIYFEKLLQPYLIIGHCFDKSVFFLKSDKSDQASRLSMATQAGVGGHLNITPMLDVSVSGQYMLHFGRELEIKRTSDTPTFQVADFTHPSGHLLFTLSANFKFGRLWKS